MCKCVLVIGVMNLILRPKRFILKLASQNDRDVSEAMNENISAQCRCINRPIFGILTVRA